MKQSGGLVTFFQTEEETVKQPESSVGVIDLAVSSTAVRASDLSPEVLLAVRATATRGTTHLMATGAWTWEQLRDYVCGQIDSRWGARPHDALKESGIFKGFVNRWGDQSEQIARVAFEIHGGMWRGAPIGVQRFAKGSDPYFAEIIASTL